MSDGGMVGLWRRCTSSRDESDWERLVEVLEPKIRSAVIAAYLELELRPGWEQVEERVQDVYCRLLDRDRRALRSFRGGSEGEVASYLRSVGRSVVVDCVRRSQAGKRGGGWYSIQPAEPEDAPVAERIADSRPSPDERYAVKEWREWFLRECFRVLPASAARDRKIFRLAHMEGLSSREIAAELGGVIDPGSVDSVLYRQRLRLAKHGLKVPHRRTFRR